MGMMDLVLSFDVIEYLIFAGSLIFILGAFSWRKNKTIAKVFICIGVAVVITTGLLIGYVIEEEKRQAKMREMRERSEQDVVCSNENPDVCKNLENRSFETEQ